MDGMSHLRKWPRRGGFVAVHVNGTSHLQRSPRRERMRGTLGGANETFRLEWYRANRQHELELNKATLAYEHERIKLLVYANVAAAGAYFTLMKDRTPFDCFSVGAIAAWTAGLVFAYRTWSVAHRGQREFTRAYKFRRQGEEVRRGVGSGLFEELDWRADVARDSGERETDSAWCLAKVSLFFFVVGVVLAIYAISKIPADAQDGCDKTCLCVSGPNSNTAPPPPSR